MSDWQRLLPLVKKLARKYSYGQIELYEDLVQEGTIGLLQAVKRFNSTHSSKATFVTFAHAYIRGSILHYLRKYPVIKEDPFDDFLTETLADTTPDKAALIDVSDYIQDLLKVLPSKHKTVIEHVFIQDLTQYETAAKLGLTKMSVSRCVRTAIKKLQAAHC
jgi:RNA polymerase sigma factor (sigma-70 family)